MCHTILSTEEISKIGGERSGSFHREPRNQFSDPLGCSPQHTHTHRQKPKVYLSHLILAHRPICIFPINTRARSRPLHHCGVTAAHDDHNDWSYFLYLITWRATIWWNCFGGLTGVWQDILHVTRKNVLLTLNFHTIHINNFKKVFKVLGFRSNKKPNVSNISTSLIINLI